MATKTASSARQRISADKRLVVIGASAGGIEAVGKLLSELPGSFGAAILAVIHIPPESPSALPAIFQRETRLKLMGTVRNCDAIRHGCVYVAPPDCHLLVNDGKVRLSNGPHENRHRPAIDPLFRSAAGARGPNVIGIILTGNLGDGSAGLQAIKECGGITIVQEPKDAQFPEMPRNALERSTADYVVPLAKMGDLLKRLVEKPPPQKKRPTPCRVMDESEIADLGLPLNWMDRLGKRSQFACPECHGVLWELKEGKPVRFRCRVGHAYSLESLNTGMSEAAEKALWIATRALEEKISLLDRMAEDSRQRHHPASARHFQVRAEELKPAARSLRALLAKKRAEKAPEE